MQRTIGTFKKQTNIMHQTWGKTKTLKERESALDIEGNMKSGYFMLYC